MKNKKAFTLIELLAVIVILSVILVIAVPKMKEVVGTSKKSIMENNAKSIAKNAEVEYTKRVVYKTLDQVNDPIECSDVIRSSKNDYLSCEITFVDNEAHVVLVGKDKFDGLSICEATKSYALATTESCL